MIGICRAPQTTSRPVGLLAEASVTRLPVLLSTTVVKLERGGHLGVHFSELMQLYMFKTVQILAYFYTEYLYIFFTSKGGGRAGSSPPPLNTPLHKPN